MGERDEEPAEPWQLDRRLWLPENQHLLDRPVDLTIIVDGEESTNTMTFGCHRVILVKASPVFEDMLYRPVDDGSTREIEISDTTPQAFKAIVEFLYAGTYNYLEFNDALQLVSTTENYKLCVLQRLAVKNVMLKLRPNNAIALYEFCDSSDTFLYRNMKQRVWKMILECTDEVITAESFQDAKKSTILSIVEQESLQLSDESVLIGACDKWAQHQTEGTHDTNRLRATLGDIFKLLRFMTVRTKYISVIDSICIITEDEKTEVKNALSENNTNESIRLFNNVDQIVDERCFYTYDPVQFRYYQGITNYDCKCEQKRSGNNINNRYFGSINIDVSYDVALVGLKIKPVVLKSDEDLFCNITIKDNHCGRLAYSGSKKINCVNTKNNICSQVCIIFDNPIYLTRYRIYNIVSTISETEGKYDSPMKNQSEEVNMDIRDIVENTKVEGVNSLIESFMHYKIF